MAENSDSTVLKYTNLNINKNHDDSFVNKMDA